MNYGGTHGPNPKRHRLAHRVPALPRDLPFTTPSGRPIPRGKPATNPDDLIDWVGNGDIIHPFPAHVLYHWGVTHVRWIPITDMPPLPYALVWRTESEPVRALAKVIDDLSDAP